MSVEHRVAALAHVGGQHVVGHHRLDAGHPVDVEPLGERHREVLGVERFQGGFGNDEPGDASVAQPRRRGRVE